MKLTLHLTLKDGQLLTFDKETGNCEDFCALLLYDKDIIWRRLSSVLRVIEVGEHKDKWCDEMMINVRGFYVRMRINSLCACVFFFYFKWPSSGVKWKKNKKDNIKWNSKDTLLFTENKNCQFQSNQIQMNEKIMWSKITGQ